MKPNEKTKFLPISELVNYQDGQKWFCCAVVFSPDTENQHFHGCPPYITISDVSGMADDDIYFEIPAIVAYYAKTHPGYTMAEMQRRIEEGERNMKLKIKDLLSID